MIIERIDIRCFGRLKNLTLDFSEGLNVIEGANESGKSTIASFIKYMLYGFETTEREGSLSERRKRINWQSGIAEGSMQVKVKGKSYLINRSTVTTEQGGRVMYKEESSIIDLENGTPAFGKLPAGEVFFNVSRELFENTAYLGQVGDASINEGSVKESIENILFSANERINTQKALARITDKMESLIHQGHTGGAIIDLIRKKDELEERLRIAEDANRQILAKEAELHELRARRDEAQVKRDKLLDLDECYRNVMLIQTFETLHELEEKSEAAAEAYDSFIKASAVNGFVPEREYLTEIAVARRSVDDAYTRLTEAQDAYNREKSAVGITKEIEGAIETSDTLGGEVALGGRVGKLSLRKLLFAAGTVGALLLALSALVAVAAVPTLTTPLLILAIAGAVIAAGAGIFCATKFITLSRELDRLIKSFSCESADELRAKLTVIADARRKRDTMMSNLENARTTLERAKIDSENARGELLRVAIRFSENPPLTGLNEFLDGLERRVEEFLAEKERLLFAKNEMEITVREIRRTLQDKSEIDIRAQVAPIKRKILSGMNHEEIITGLAEARSTIEEQQSLMWGVEGDLAALKLKIVDSGELHSRIQELEGKIEELRAKHKAYFVAERAISSAQDNLRAEISPRLGEYATAMLEIMTAKKYSTLTVDEALKVSFTSDEARGKSVDYLSGGTRDLTYIAVRLALVDMLFSEKPPICFDETFANQDNLRAEAMMKAIGALVDEGHQSFVFTCREREGVLAQKTLPGSGVFKLSVTGE